MKSAQRGIITEEIKIVADTENLSVESLKQRVANGRVIIPKNVRREGVKLVAIGEGLSTKVNVNVGTSTVFADLDMEIEKAKVALNYGTDTLMDLSTGGDLDLIRRSLIKICHVPFGTVPIYQAYIEATRKFGSFIHMNEDLIFNSIERHLEDGVDFITVHTGVTKNLAEKLKKVGRTAGIVSRGGSILVAWMLHNGLENPLYAHYDYLLELASRYDITLSLGDALRPGSIVDAHDEFQIEELMNNARLAKLARERCVQVMIEG
ncbi:MAG: phosphomethylpyrimidine synthase ThiC, partial [Nitrososphaerales archaeon]|nr:phosphomethylpyrimidine synthase ThiC [Nitrososphaerales archaeon]